MESFCHHRHQCMCIAYCHLSYFYKYLNDVYTDNNTFHFFSSVFCQINCNLITFSSWCVNAFVSRLMQSIEACCCLCKFFCRNKRPIWRLFRSKELLQMINLTHSIIMQQTGYLLSAFPAVVL